MDELSPEGSTDFELKTNFFRLQNRCALCRKCLLAELNVSLIYSLIRILFAINFNRVWSAEFESYCWR